MPHEGQEIKRANGFVVRIVTLSEELLEVEASYRGDAPLAQAHFHPSQDEHFEVLEGELTVITGDEERRTLRAGDTIEIPRGLVHRMWNSVDAATRATWRITPALKSEEMFRTIASGGREDFLEAFADEFRFPG